MVPDTIPIIGTKTKQLVLNFLSNNGNREFSVKDLHEKLDIPESTLSKNLDELRNLGVLSARKHGKFKYYSLNTRFVPVLKETFGKFKKVTSSLNRRKVKGVAAFIFLIFIFSLASIEVQAGIPRSLNVQGKLTNATTGAALTGLFNMSFRIYNQSAGGTVLWFESQELNAKNGVYDAILGLTNPLTLDFDTNYYLAIEVNSSGEMSPRVNVTSTPHTYRSITSENVSCTDCLGSVQVDDIYVFNTGDEISGDLNITGTLLVDTEVGIGTTSPGLLLELNSSSNPGMRIRNSAYGKYFDLSYTDSGGLYILENGNKIAQFHPTQQGLIIGAGYATGAYSPPANGTIIQGNVGIGTTGPSSLLHLNDSADINLTLDRQGWVGGETSNIRFRHGNNDNYMARIGSWVEGSGSNVALRFFTSSGGAEYQRMVIRGSGNVGIGTTSPNTRLAINATTDQLGIIDSDGSQEWRIAANSNLFYVEDDNSGAIPFKIEDGADTDTLFIDDSGQVGIGTTTPGATLGVHGSGTGGLSLNVTNDLFVNDTSGYVGINTTSPKAPLSFATVVGQKIEFYNAGTNNEFGIGVESNELRISAGSSSKIAFRTDGYNGNERMVIDTDGDVGINDTSPDDLLSVMGGNVNIGYAGGSSVNTLLVTSSSVWSGAAGYDAAIYGGLYIGGGGSQNTIIANGDVGIGTASPSQELDIEAYEVAIELNDTRVDDPKVWTFQSELSGGGTHLRIKDSTTTRLDIDSSGNVGIGTSSPGAKLDVENLTAGVNELIRLSHENAYDSGAKISWWANDAGEMNRIENNLTTDETTSGNLAFYTYTTAGGLTEKMRIMGIGNVGINTTDPDSLVGAGPTVHIAGTNPSFDLERITSGTEAKASLRIADTEDLVFRVQDGAASAIDAMTILSDSGNVGINTTTPEGELEVNGGNDGVNVYIRADPGQESNLYLGGDNDVHRLRLKAHESTGEAHIGNPTNYALKFFTNGIANTAMTILTGGDVGIGQTSPSEKLHVAGNIRLGNDNTDVNIKLRDDNERVIINASRSDDTQVGKMYFDGWGNFLFDKKVGIGTSSNLQGSTASLYVNGNVGIVTDSPSNELEVNGDVELTNLYDNDASNFFDGGCSADQYISGIDSTGLISCAGDSGTGTMSSWTIAGDSGSTAVTNGQTVTIAGSGTIDTSESSRTVTVSVQSDSIDDAQVVNDGLDASSLADDSVSDSELDGGFGWTLDTDLNIDSNTLVVSYDDNRVGIGTASPSSDLHVNTAAINDAITVGSSSNTGYSGVNMQTDETTGAWIFAAGSTYDSWSLTSALNIYNADGPIAFQTNGGNNRMVIDTLGKVGINTTNPTELLQIGDDDADPTILIESDNAGNATIEFGEAASARGSIWYTGDGFVHYGMNARAREHFKTFYTDNDVDFKGSIYPGTGSAFQTSYRLYQDSSGIRTNGAFYVDGDLTVTGENILWGTTDISESDIDALDDGVITLGTETSGTYCSSATCSDAVDACSDCDGTFVNEAQADSITSGMMAHNDHGDVTWATGSAVVENVQCSGCISEGEIAQTSSLDTSEIEDIYVLNNGDTMTGPLVMSSTYVNINRAGATDTGINWYSSTYDTWATYMAPTGASMGPRGTLTVPSGNLVTSWGVRNYIEDAAGYGWTFESGTGANDVTPTIVAEIRSSDGSMQLDGDLTVSGENILWGTTDISESDIDALDDGVITLGTETSGTYCSSSSCADSISTCTNVYGCSHDSITGAGTYDTCAEIDDCNFGDLLNVGDNSGTDLSVEENAVIGGDLTVTGEDIYLDATRLTDSASTGYFRVDPQNNMMILYDGATSAQTMRVFGASGSDYIEMVGSTTTNLLRSGGTTDIQIEADGGDVIIKLG